MLTFEIIQQATKLCKGIIFSAAPAAWDEEHAVFRQISRGSKCGCQ